MQSESPIYPPDAFSPGQRTLRGLSSGLAGGALGGLAAGYLYTWLFAQNLIDLPWLWSAAFALTFALINGRLLGPSLERRLRVSGLGYMLAASVGYWIAIALLAFLFPQMLRAIDPVAQSVQTILALARVAAFAMIYGAVGGIVGGTLFGALLTPALARRVQGFGWLLGLIFVIAIAAYFILGSALGVGLPLVIACASAALGGFIAEKEYKRLLFHP